jgi:hypothetical protein
VNRLAWGRLAQVLVPGIVSKHAIRVVIRIRHTSAPRFAYTSAIQQLQDMENAHLLVLGYVLQADASKMFQIQIKREVSDLLMVRMFRLTDLAIFS